MANTTRDHSITDWQSLQKVLRQAQEPALLVSQWLLRKVIDNDRADGHGPAVARHGRVHVISRAALLDIINQLDLPLAPDQLPAGPMVLLLAQPDADFLSITPAPQVLRAYWRLLFHAIVDWRMREKIVSDADAHDRIDRVGAAVFGDSRYVLLKEGYISWSCSAACAYAEFAAVFLELYHFARPVLKHFFPAIEDADRVLSILGQDIDIEELLKETRPSGAADADVADNRAARDSRRRHDDDRQPRQRFTLAYRKSLLARADRAEELGNLVRGAILRMQVCRAMGDEAGGVYDRATRDLNLLVNRLQAALDLDDTAAGEWRSGLKPLLANAAQGWWNPEGRLLYDLQKVCLDHEREIYSVSVVDWLLRFCRVPLRRPVPAQRMVLKIKHLHAAERRVGKVRVDDHARHRLEYLFRAAAHQADHQLRETFRQPVLDALRRGGLMPRNGVERIAELKLVEELLDGASHRGFLTMGDLRDALARNRLKLPDLTDPAPIAPAVDALASLPVADVSAGQPTAAVAAIVPPSGNPVVNFFKRLWRGTVRFLRGDQLLQTNRQVGDVLEGVYRRGEAYLRFFQRLSSLFFANVVGRTITRYLIMPFGGAWLLLEALDHTLILLFRLITGLHFELNSPYSAFGLGLVLLGVIHWPAFRAFVIRCLGYLGPALKAVFIDAPRWLITRDIVQRVARSRAMRLTMRYGVKPLALAAVAYWLLPARIGVPLRIGAASAIFLALNLMLNSAMGRAIEEAAVHALGVMWTRITGSIIAGIFRFILHFFRRLLEDIERMLYAVDEWLRFRRGQSSMALVGKAALGFVWFYIAYLTRFAMNLLLEPQVNPIKHFPVVTVSHKIILPTQPLWASALRGLGMQKVQAQATAAAVVTSIPGIFGFLAWELQGNWRLYAANQRRSLRPVRVGSHGESMAALLRPGFHSGTLPKAFNRLRRAAVKAGSRRAIAALHKQQGAIEHVREAVLHFVEREIVALVNQHPAFAASPIEAESIKLFPTRIAIEISCPAAFAKPLCISIEQRNGWIFGGIDDAGFLPALDEPRRSLMAVAIAGLYRMSAVDIVREQLMLQFAGRAIGYEIQRRELIVWPAGQYDARVVYNLAHRPLAPVAAASGQAATAMPTLDPDRLFFRQEPIDWADWAALWDARAAATEVFPWAASLLLPAPDDAAQCLVQK